MRNLYTSWSGALLAVALGLLTFTAQAQDTGDLDEMALKDLLNIQIGQRALMDVQHTHPKGEWMISYRYMYMHMSGNRTGTISRSIDAVLEDYMVAPVDMSMQMHMIGVMYTPTHHVSLMAMIPFHRMTMDHVTRSGMTFGAASQGLADVSLTALYSVYENDVHRFVVNLGVSLPVGSVDARDDLPAGDDALLAYPMQLGSGSIDPIVGATYIGLAGDWSWGAHLKGVFRMTDNSQGYRVSNEHRLTAWISRTWHPWFSSTLRLDGEHQENYQGIHPDLNPMMVPTADPNLRGGRQLTAALGLNVHAPKGTLEGHQFSIEAGVPTYRHLHGPQLERDFFVRGGWSVTL